VDITTLATSIKNNVVIGDLKETSHALAVGGTIYSDNDIFSFSDIRKKTGVRRIRGALERVLRLRGVVYRRRGDAPGKRCTGVIAQEVARVLPEAVHQDPGTGYLGVAYGNLAGLLIEAIKELHRRTVRHPVVRVAAARRTRAIGNRACENK
jgi:hypothetical protein